MLFKPLFPSKGTAPWKRHSLTGHAPDVVQRRRRRRQTSRLTIFTILINFTIPSLFSYSLHLYSVTAIPSKTYTTADINAHVWLIDVNGPSATTKVTVMRLINNIQARLQCSICSCILRGFIWLQGALSWLHIMSWVIETLSAVLRDLGRPLPDFRSVDPQLWFF